MPKMGIKKPKLTNSTPVGSSVADALFTKVQQRVLAVLFGNHARSFYANELIALVASGSGAVQRELAQLEGAELVTVSRVGNQKHYQANSSAPIFEELHGLVLKTVLAQPKLWVIGEDSKNSLLSDVQRSLSDYLADELCQSAVERQLEIAGDALGQMRKLDAVLSSKIPDGAPVVAFRNVLAHGYATLDHRRVYEIASSRGRALCCARCGT